MRIYRSAFKHGVAEANIETAVASSHRRFRIGEDPVRWLYLGSDTAGRFLEIITIMGDDGGETVIHAMKARKQYLDPTSARRRKRK
ncbi:hypothetical protein HMPREF9306_00246 [Propionimicrobium lymphophilum ACS-093-V-SCH5]|uniref:Toxin-antitoxin system, toxin component n=1 Tax=Propionimicrobium lymphophilum ACS-093-V-SCH5 TaxID=883161 RepID=S2W3U9_9ACTN|nr:hypothetical protein [Propionimicrobium lymphophilum]EPD33831.1 hypothetical protein HMPREF9306_00246 [Propionimicrobium lymphophilum ACS-093-V-SCH5]